MGRAPCCDKANVKKGPWSPEEDAKLKDYIEKYGTGGNWIALPQKIGLKRCGKSCRLRWLNYLRPNIKHGGFTEEEDTIICSLYISIGSRWSIIAAQLPGRTDNDIKNYWNTRLKKKLLGRRKQPVIANQAPETKHGPGEDTTAYNLQNLSSSALERLQLHIHLQSLENPSSFYNNPPLWPKLNAHKTIQAVHLSNPTLQKPSTSQPDIDSLVVPGQDFHHRGLKTDGPGETAACFSPSERSVNESGVLELNPGVLNPGSDQIPGSGFTQAEIDDLLSNRPSSFHLPTGNQMVDFNCFKEGMGGSRDANLAWWSNEFDVNSSSSNSWGSTNLLHQCEGMYHDYDLGFSVQ